MDVIVDYEIKSQLENAVSFTVDFGEGWVTAAQERYCYNLDLAENRDITLRDLLGDAWVERCNQAVQSYIAAHTDEHGYTLFFDSEAGGFTTVDESTRFYIRSDGIPVLVFQGIPRHNPRNNQTNEKGRLLGGLFRACCAYCRRSGRVTGPGRGPGRDSMRG